MDHKSFTKYLIKWYKENKRELPWRHTSDPFKIWLSEVIMQQTRVVQGLPYYVKFTKRFSTINALAYASEEEVLQLWQGLGYYSRGRNLLKGAQMIVEDFNGIMPDSYAGLLKIKGIGKYTAAAVASIAFGEAVPCIDGNVYRVLSRVFGLEEDMNYSTGQKLIQELSEKLMDKRDPGSYNQAVMEFGALQCVPKNPDCNSCIFYESCYARIYRQQSVLPFNSKKIKKKNRFMDYVLFSRGTDFLLKKRNGKDIWQGLYDFHILKEENELRTEEEVMKELRLIVNENDTMQFRSSKDYKQILSHQNIFARITRIEVGSLKELQMVAEKTSMGKFSINKMEALPKPVLINKYLNDELF